MDQHAHKLLRKLLLDAEMASFGCRSRAAALTSRQHLAQYRSSDSFEFKERFETTMRAARAAGAVTLTWDEKNSEEGFIRRVDIICAEKLARFIGATPLAVEIALAEELFAPWSDKYPVLDDVIRRWSQLRKVRTLGPTSTRDWLDAIRVVEYVRSLFSDQKTFTPVREASARLFKNSKRIERLAAPLNVLLAGSVDAEIREPAEVWKELGLVRQEQPVRLAGKVEIERTRVSGLLDAPYAAFPAPSVIRLITVPNMVLTIENQTTFHSEALRMCEEQVLLIYTAGMPSPTWRAMYARLLLGLPEEVPVFHWGDVDEGGFRIASILAQDARAAGHVIQPWRMASDDIPPEQRRKASPGTLKRMRYFADAAGWAELGKLIEEAGFTVEQEALD